MKNSIIVYALSSTKAGGYWTGTCFIPNVVHAKFYEELKTAEGWKTFWSDEYDDISIRKLTINNGGKVE